MSFDVRCVFSGLCSYVPNGYLDPSNPDGLPTKMAVLMVNAREAKSGIDGELMVPHFPVLAVDARFLPNSSLPQGTQIIWPLDRLALRFEVDQEQPEDFSVALYGNDDFRLGPAMGEAAPDFAVVDPLCFEDEDSEELIAARLILNRGRLSSHRFRPQDVPTFDFNDVLGSTSEPRRMSNRAALGLNHVRSFKVAWRRLDGAKSERYFELRANDDDLMKLSIGNVCSGCLPEGSGGVSRIGPFKDVDFRWYYELCRDREHIDIPEGSSLPIPETGGSGGPGAIQCMRTSFAPYSF